MKWSPLLSLVAIGTEALNALGWSSMAQRPIDLESSQAKINSPNAVKSFTNNAWKTWDYITHSNHEGYSMRIKETKPESLGVDVVRQYSGYFDILLEDKHFFYWFFESRNDPVNDPVVLWLNGGPGCSSMTGLFFELGPSSIGKDLKPVYNPHSWNSNASVIFLEQPVGVGYSYSSQNVASTSTAAKDVYAFLELFFTKFEHLSQNGLHISGESYAGHYLPAIGSEIVNHPGRNFNFKSVIIGNGLTNAKVQHASFRAMACGAGGVPQIISDDECDWLDSMTPKCAALIDICLEFPSELACRSASQFCVKMLEPVLKTGLNPYDLRVQCANETSGCYEQEAWYSTYLNDPEVMEALGAEVNEYVSCSSEVSHSFAITGDRVIPFDGHVRELLEYHIPVLIYAGDKDFRCNWIGNHQWSDALPWWGHDNFKEENLKPWFTGHSGDLPAGEVKSFGNFTFLRIYEAGHMVPFNQPENSLAMINSWIAGDYSLATS